MGRERTKEELLLIMQEIENALKNEPEQIKSLNRREYRPFTNVEEFMKTWKLHGIFLYTEDPPFYHFPTKATDKGLIIDKTFYNYREILDLYTFSDGTPCGIKE